MALVHLLRGTSWSDFWSSLRGPLEAALNLLEDLLEGLLGHLLEGTSLDPWGLMQGERYKIREPSPH